VVDGTAHLGVGNEVKDEESVPDEPIADPVSQEGHDEHVVFDSAKEKSTSPTQGDHPKDEL
jgi:hypothetical protein